MASRRRKTRKNREKPPRQATTDPPVEVDSEPAKQRALTRGRLLLIVIVLLGSGAVAVLRLVSQRAFQEGLADLEIHRLDRADQHLQSAGRFFGRGGEVALMRGRVAWVRGDMEASEGWIRRASAEGYDPQRVEHERSLMQIRSGSVADQDSLLPTMLQRQPDNGPAILEAFAAGYMARGDVDKAAEVLELWQQASANDPRVPYWRGKLYQAYGSEQEAIEHFQQALQIEPAMTPARLALASLLRSLFFYPEAIPQYQRVLKEQPGTSEAQLGLAISQLRSGQVEQGLPTLKAIIASEPGNVTARLVLAEHYQGKNRAEDLLETIEPLLDADLGEIMLHYLASSAYHQLDQQEQSEKHFEKFQQLSRQLETTKFMAKQYNAQPSAELAGRIASDLMECKWEDAGNWILKGLSHRPRSIEFNEMMARYLRRAGRTSLADHYQRYAERLQSAGNSEGS